MYIISIFTEDAKDNIGYNDSVNTGDCCDPSSGDESDESGE